LFVSYALFLSSLSLSLSLYSSSSPVALSRYKRTIGMREGEITESARNANNIL
jgi:hypothetical protein